MVFWNFLATTGKDFRRLVEKLAEEAVGGLLPADGGGWFTPDVAERRRKFFDLLVSRREEEIATVAKAVPYYEEIVTVFQNRLNEIENLQAELARKAPAILKDMKKTAEEADKLAEQVEKLLSDLRRKEDKNLLGRIGANAMKHQELAREYAGLKDELALLEPQPDFPPMHDLPNLPNKVWHIALTQV